MTPPGLVIGVYRARNADQLLSLLRTAGTSARVALWALDSVAPQLQTHTVGEGAGAKFELLNRLISIASPYSGEAVVAVDDDITFVRGGVAEFLDVSVRAGFDLAQPAHAPGSHVSHDITRRRRFSVARLTTFVEIGPVFACMPHRRSDFIPFPEHAGMGWGLDLEWHDRYKEGAVLGIVDRVAVRHHEPPGVEYDLETHRAENQQRLRSRGVERMRDVQAVLETWRPWRSRPPWAAGVS